MKNVNCEIIEDLFSGYIEGSLNNETSKLVEEHLLTCNKCKKKLEEFKNAINEKNTDMKKVDYFKKAKKHERLKGLKLGIIIVLAVFLIIYLYNFIIFNSIISTAKNSLESDNIYIQSMDYLLDDEVSVTRRYYKDGKYKEIQETYNDDGIKQNYIIYAVANSDELIRIDNTNKKILIQKGEETKQQISEKNLKFVPFVNDDRFIFKVTAPIAMSINSEKFKTGSFSNNNKNCYVLNYRLESNKSWEIWLDKDTGLPLKEINIDGLKSYYSDTSLDKNIEYTKENINEILKEQNDILKDTKDSITEYKYEFGIVKDEDVSVPDLSTYNDYEIINSNF